jgi:hypothetical protein
MEQATISVVPLFFSWRGGSTTKRAVHEGETYTQNASETREAFLNRLAQAVPTDAVVWID